MVDFNIDTLYLSTSQVMVSVKTQLSEFAYTTAKFTL